MSYWSGLRGREYSDKRPLPLGLFRVHLYGGECFDCGRLETNIRMALEKAGHTPKFRHIRSHNGYAQCAGHPGPVFVADGSILSCGIVPSIEEIVHLLTAGCREIDSVRRG